MGYIFLEATKIKLKKKNSLLMSYTVQAGFSWADTRTDKCTNENSNLRC